MTNWVSHVLFGVSGSDACVRAARRLPELIGRHHRASILAVVPPARAWAERSPAGALSEHEAVARAIDEVHEALAVQAIEAAARELAMDAVGIIEEGDPAEVICEAARRQGAELIVLGSAGWRLPGACSTGREVMEHAECPVLVLGHCEV